MTQDDEIAEILLRWEEAYEHGEDIPPVVLCADRPELEPNVRRRIEALKGMAWVEDGLGGGVSGDGTGDVEDDSPLPIPTILGGRYRVEGLIAEGGFGQVYRGHDEELRRPVAVKVPRPRRVAGPEQADLLLEEARKVARLRHPGIVAVHDVGRSDGTEFIVSDLIEGENLADRIARSRPTPREAVRLVAEVAEALHHAHELGFVHRDIKPANILIDRQGQPLITDFGIASTADDLARGRGASSGTLPYMAPEQVAGEIQLIDARTDIYALGVVLYELLAGRSPYQARTPTALREQILFRAPLRLPPPAGGVSPELEGVVMRCLAKHPADRCSTARELAGELRACPTRRMMGRSTWLIPPVAFAVISAAVVAFQGVPRLLTGSRPTPEGPKGVVPALAAEPSRPPPKVAPPSVAELGRPAINLLPHFQPERHSVGPPWVREGASLVSPPGPYSRIVSPHHPPREYVLRAVVRRRRGLDMVVLGLTSGESQFVAVFDTGPGIVSGLALLDGAHLNNLRNETRHVGGVIPMHVASTITCVVREAGVHVSCDGQTIMDWAGRPEQLGLPPEWRVEDTRALFLGSQEGIVCFERIEIIGL
jgi:serine/threonine protein kinase